MGNYENGSGYKLHAWLEPNLWWSRHLNLFPCDSKRTTVRCLRHPKFNWVSACENITFDILGMRAVKIMKTHLLTMSTSNELLPAVSCETWRGLRFTSRTDIQALKNPSGTAYGIPSIQNLGCLNNSITPVLNTKWIEVQAFARDNIMWINPSFRGRSN